MNYVVVRCFHFDLGTLICSKKRFIEHSFEGVLRFSIRKYYIIISELGHAYERGDQAVKKSSQSRQQARSWGFAAVLLVSWMFVKTECATAKVWTIEHVALASGSGKADSSVLTSYHTLGQIDSGDMNGISFTFRGGFWPKSRETIVNQDIFSDGFESANLCSWTSVQDNGTDPCPLSGPGRMKKENSEKDKS